MAGKAHRAKLSQFNPDSVEQLFRSTNPSSNKTSNGPLSIAIGSRFSTCPDCGNIMARSREKGHRCYDADAKSAGNEKWICDVCGTEMDAGNRESHLAGKKHAAWKGKGTTPHPNGKNFIKIDDVANVYDDVCEIPRHCYETQEVFQGRWKGGRTLVSAADVQQASNQFDGEGLLEDIDTQWGLFPHGGAYKDSDEYYSDDFWGY